MGFAFELARRYMASKKRAFVSVGTLLAVLGVTLGTAALATVMSVTGGFRAEFREKVLGVNAHVLVLKYTSDFREYRDIMQQMEDVPGVVGIAPFVINPMMVTHGDKTATGVLLKGVDPERMPQVLDLPRHIKQGSIDGLRLEGAKPPERRRGSGIGSKKKKKKSKARLSDADAGAKRRLHDAIQESIEASGDAGAPDASATGAGGSDVDIDEEALEALEGDEDVPVGAIEPDGGYAPLPDDDDEDQVIEDLYPDPCESIGAGEALPGIIIGSTLKDNLGVELGDCVQVTSPTIGYRYLRGGAVRPPVAKQFRVIAVFEAGFDQYDSKLVYTDLFEAQAFGDNGDSVTGVEMKVTDINQAKAIARDIDKRLNNGIYHTMDWEELNHGLFTALRIQQLMMSLVLALIILVAAFTLIATLIMVVLDKKREIAVLKAMGATDGKLLLAFLYQGGIVGVIGTVLGLGLGLAVCKLLLVYGFPLDPKVYFISQLPVVVRPLEFALTGMFAILVCLVATVWPALYAARLRPAEAFREQ